ncbi:MAG TPA: prepilin-type N-terminal cleavage/methylation domain-containing protein [Candidatus Saccharimonadales bacterium]|nr:prepilin-type N-terminal cleavage/methylation domain-containing protein [Candidatus Saccharimonadales bacterium]
MFKRLNNQNGYTVLELLVVVIFIGILVALVLLR